MKKYIRKSLYTLILLSVLTTLQGCFTGVESTKKITLSKKELQSVAPTNDEMFLAEIHFPILKDWLPGKEFIVADSKFGFLLEKQENSLEAGDTLQFLRIDSRIAVDGSEKAVLIFSHKGFEINFPIGKPLDFSMKNLSSADIPLLIDLETVNSVKEITEGKKVWTKTPHWYDNELKYKKGLQFVEVTILNISAGNVFFPVRVSFRDEKGEEGVLYMNVGNTGGETRTFDKLFSLHNPRKDYKNISAENWESIQKAAVRLGMTKDECRLAIGSPSDIDSGHDYSRAIEIWRYPDGVYLQFVDGILTNYK